MSAVPNPCRISGQEALQPVLCGICFRSEPTALPGSRRRSEGFVFFGRHEGYSQEFPRSDEPDKCFRDHESATGVAELEDVGPRPRLFVNDHTFEGTPVARSAAAHRTTNPD